MCGLLQETEYPYNLGNNHALEHTILKLYTMGLKVSFMGPKIRSFVPSYIKKFRAARNI